MDDLCQPCIAPITTKVKKRRIRKNRNRKKCNESECTKNAREKSDKCKEHGGGRRCSESGCTNSAVDITNKCIRHGGGKRCAENDCTKAADGTTDKCKAHGGGKRCTESGCTRSARNKYDKCASHGGGDRCTERDCTKAAVDKTKKCYAHGGNRCTENGCSKFARGDKCRKHGGGKRCTENMCTKSPQGNSDKCVVHGGGKRCPNCITWPDSRCGKNAYDGYCATCFKQLFPNDERIKVYTHTKEMRVRNRINTEFDGFIHDRPLYTGECDCTHRRRIDHRKLIGGTLLCVETDEFAHRGYDQNDEIYRYNDLYMIHSGKWIFIRFNPDGRGVEMEDKLEILIETMYEQIQRIEDDENTELVEIIKLFY